MLLLKALELLLCFLDLGPEGISLTNYRLAVSRRTQSQLFTLFFELLEADYQFNLVIQLLFYIITHEGKGSLQNFTISHRVNVSNPVFEDVEILRVASNLAKRPVVKALVNEIFHANGKQWRILLLAVIEENALSLGHLGCSI